MKIGFKAYLFLVLVGSITIQSRSILAAEIAPIVVSMDNPNFRKLSIAVPRFFDSSEKLGAVSLRGAEEITNLLNFSGLFNVMSEKAYADVAKKVEATWAKNPARPAPNNLAGFDLQAWRAIGVEAVILSEIRADRDGSYIIDMRTIDMNRGLVLVGKSYGGVKPTEFTRVMRRYCDLVLEAFTGKPGIFNSRLVFVGRRNKKDHKQIYMSDFDGSNVEAITKGSYAHLSPQWSSDGKYITYTSYRDGKADLFIYDLASGKERKLSGKKGINSGGNWSPDDKVIAFTGSVDGNADIYLIEPFGKSDRKLFISGSSVEVDPAFSPDKKYIAFVSGRFGNPHLFRGDLQWTSPTEVRIVNEKRLTFAGWYNAVPAWSPDSEKIAFASDDKEIARFDIFMIDPEGKKIDRLTLRTGDNESPSWSPNGQLISFHSNRTNGTNVKSVAQLYVMNRDGSSQRKLETGLYEAQTPKWSRQMDN